MTNELSGCAKAIRDYKSRVNDEGAVAWADVPTADDIRMHIPAAGLRADGPDEIASKVFGLMAAMGLRQQLERIEEFGPYVTCFLRVTAGDGAAREAVEVFRVEDGRVAEIWAL